MTELLIVSKEDSNVFNKCIDMLRVMRAEGNCQEADSKYENK